MAVPTFPVPPAAKHEEGFLNSKDHLRLYWQRFAPPEPRAAVAVLHGYLDHCGRYPGLTRSLVEAGFATSLVDFRGHGQSDGRRAHIDHFADYLNDLDAFVAKVKADAGGRPTFLVAHSQGALIASLWVIERKPDVAGVVLSSPYLRLALRPPMYKVAAARVLDRLAPWLPISTGLDLADLTRDEEMQRWTEQDPLYGRAATPRWWKEFQRAQADVLGRAGEIAVPLLVLVGTADTIADPATMRAFHRSAGSKDKACEVYEGFRHELFNEVGRERPLADTVAWIAARAAASAR
jgi:alpha-beta hydrolase superfamily lysophospholipase